MNTPPKICFLSLFHDTEERDPARYLDDIHLYRCLPQSVAARGFDVRFVLLFPIEARYQEGSVDYHFVVEPAPVRAAARLAGRLLDRRPARFEPATRTLRRVAAIQPDLVHVHGVDPHINLALLRAVIGRTGVPIVLHYHGGFPAERGPVRTLQRYSFAGISRFLFTTKTHARPFVERGLVRSTDDVVELMELSSPFEMRLRAACRAETGMTGRPVFVWTGRLDPIKDPLTALRGFERIRKAWPEAALYMYFSTAELLTEVRSFLAARPGLRERVDLRGRAPYRQMEAIYNSADFLIQASRREFSGCAVLEALSCGVLPVVTDIPSFRAMTDDGRHGLLFPVGDAEGLAAAVLRLTPESIPARSVAVRAHFEERLSYEALGRRLDGVYRCLLDNR